MKKLAKILIIPLSLAVIYIALLFWPQVTLEKGVDFVVVRGTGKKALVMQLTQQGIIQTPVIFTLYLYLNPNVQLKSGEYLFPKGSSIYSIWHQVTTGTGLLYRPFTIVPGTTFAQIKQQLASNPFIQHITQDMNNNKIMLYLGAPDVMPEGEFFPETYYYSRGDSDLALLKRAYALMQTKMSALWAARDANLPYPTPYAALIAASLIEKEAYFNAERPIIAGVLVKRLQKNMLLQFDPTVIYGMGDRYQGQIHGSDLMTDTTYNTYLHKGLPPTPIAIPSEQSIYAALHPQVNDYYYFVARGNGSHQFSATLDEHHAAVAVMVKHDTTYFNVEKIRQYIVGIFARVC